MQLGQDVLDKMSQYILEIEKPKSPNRKKKEKNFFESQESRNRNQEPENGHRLYDRHKNYLNKQHDNERRKIYQEMENMQQFKVNNKHSIFLNSQKQARPIYQRTKEIIQDRQNRLSKKKAEYEREKARKKLEDPDYLNEEDEEMISRSKSTRKVTSKRQLDEILKRLTTNERNRMQKNHEEKMQYLKNKVKNNGRPQVSKESQRIFERSKIEKSLSQNVFERFEKYSWDQKKAHDQYVQEITEIYTPFRPKISKNTEEIALRISASKPSLHQNLSKNKSCKCFNKSNSRINLKKNDNHSTVANTGRNAGKSDRSLSKNNISVSPSASKVQKTKKSRHNLTINPDY